jgi:hypothetical protein
MAPDLVPDAASFKHGFFDMQVGILLNQMGAARLLLYMQIVVPIGPQREKAMLAGRWSAKANAPR